MRSMGLISNLTDPGKSENVLVFARMLSLGTAPFEFLKMHLYQYTQKIELCSNKFDFLPLFCLVGLVPNSLLSGSRGTSATSWRDDEGGDVMFVTIFAGD